MVPSPVSSPAKLHGCQFGSSNRNERSSTRTRRSGWPIAPSEVPISLPAAVLRREHHRRVFDIVRPDLAPFRAKMDPAYARIAAYAGEDNVKKFRDIVEKHRKG